MFEFLIGYWFGDSSGKGRPLSVKEVILGLHIIILVIGALGAIILFLFGYFEPSDPKSCTGTQLATGLCKAQGSIYPYLKWIFILTVGITAVRYLYKKLK